MPSDSSPVVRDPEPIIHPPPGPNRDGLSVLERKALYRVQLEIAAMPASLVVQILLWPDKMTDWARDEGVTPALVYNMLGNFKPYHGLRQRLAERLGVSKGELDHLIEGNRAQPTSRRIPDPPDDLQVASPRQDGPADRSLSGEDPTRTTAPTKGGASPDRGTTSAGGQATFDL